MNETVKIYQQALREIDQEERNVITVSEISEKFDALPTEQQKAFIRAAEQWYPAETPKHQPGHTRAEHAERVYQAEQTRQRVIRREAVGIFARSLEPSTEQKFVYAAAQGAATKKTAAHLEKEKSRAEQKREHEIELNREYNRQHGRLNYR